MRLRLTARARLAAVYVALVAAAGAVLITLTYLLVRRRTANHVTVLIGRGGDPAPPPDPAEAVRTETLNQLLTQSLIALGVVVVLAGVTGWFVAGRLLRPIRAISQTAQRVSVTDLSERVVVGGPEDELTALAGTINGMLDRVQAGVAERDRLLDSHRLFVANAAHELRTPLATMRTAIDVTMDGEPSRPELRAMIGDVSAAVDASRHTLDGLLALARSQDGAIHAEVLDLAGIAAGAVEQARADAERHEIRLTAALAPAPVRGEAVLLQRLAGNLIGNALRYNHSGGEVHVVTEPGLLRVTNTGPVVPEDDLDRLFQPFVRGTGARLRSGGGAGLGLSIVAAIATAHHGTATATAAPTGGLEVTVQLPPP